MGSADTMNRFRFVHAADLHLDTPFEGIGRTAPPVATALRDASLEAWDQLVELTIEENAVFLLVAGDLYDGAERGVRAQLRFRNGLERLSRHGIQTFIVHGNHDPLDGWSAIRTWPELVTVFGSDTVASVAVERDGQRLATVSGISYERADTSENLALRFARGAEPGLHIGLLHANAGGRPGHAAYSPCTIDDLRAARLDYWALGHIHRRQVLREGDPWIVYPGNLQGRSPKPSEAEPKGAVLVEVEEGRVTGVGFRPLDRVRFVRHTLDTGDLDDLPALHHALLDWMRPLRIEHGDRGLLARVILEGRGTLHADLSRPGAISELLTELRGECADFEPFFWWDAIVNRTHAPIDRRVIERRGDFAAELVRLSDALKADSDRLDSFAGDRLRLVEGAGLPPEVPGLITGEGGQGVLGGLLAPADQVRPSEDPADLAGLLERAEERALDLLERDDS